MRRRRLTHSLTHLGPGFKRTRLHTSGRPNRYIRPFPAAYRTPSDDLGLENGGPTSYAQSVRDATNPAAIITVHFASRKPLAQFPGLALFGKTQRMVYAANFSAPELGRAPPGWYFYCGASVPHPPCGAFDEDKEKALLLEDLHEHFPGFDEARIVAIDVTAHDWPAQRAVAGYDLPRDTPIANLWNVGDGVKPWAQGGTASCAEVAPGGGRHPGTLSAAHPVAGNRPRTTGAWRLKVTSAVPMGTANHPGRNET